MDKLKLRCKNCPASGKRYALLAHIINCRGSERTSTFVNLYNYGLLRGRPDLVEGIGNIYLDGFLIVRILNLFGAELKRQSFDMTSLAPLIFSACEQHSRSVALIGGKEGVALLAAQVIKERYPRLSFSLISTGYFESRHARSNLLNDLVRAQPNVVLIGMGSPLQEEFLSDLVKNGYTGRVYTCGAFLQQIAKGELDYYPAIVNRLGMRWLYRMMREPHVFGRTLRHYPKNFLHLILDIGHFLIACRGCK